ncbi:hypothetical protein HPB50_012785 [Hyalomma asiaticum]|uniref:Uncharacterized protein n=1 Tax=Hyalomma asiaticum TaxID=266040 RepID=A0ACB7SGI1_HYAAI|nr:hypothetical protein HPB50_012785 [Hyalomma asiaticum]
MGITRTEEQYCSRFKTVIRRKTSATTHNKKWGNSPSDVPYIEELAKIAALDDSVEPEELKDGYGVISRKDNGGALESLEDTREDGAQRVIIGLMRDDGKVCELHFHAEDYITTLSHQMNELEGS